jgi:DNA-binding response OmpR family regulator
MVKLLIAEDEILIRDLLEYVLDQNGYTICGVASTVEEAVALGRLHRPDLALLDLHLIGGLGTEIAAQLCPLGKLGVLYVTSDPSQVMLDAMDGDACLRKPFRWPDLLRALDIVREIGATGQASPPYPPGLQLLFHRQRRVRDPDLGGAAEQR